MSRKSLIDITKAHCTIHDSKIRLGVGRKRILSGKCEPFYDEIQIMTAILSVRKISPFHVSKAENQIFLTEELDRSSGNCSIREYELSEEASRPGVSP